VNEKAAIRLIEGIIIDHYKMKRLIEPEPEHFTLNRIGNILNALDKEAAPLQGVGHGDSSRTI
jgi:hypothetical protein